LVLVPTRCRHRRRAILMWWCWECRSIFLWPLDFLAASFFKHGRPARWVAPRILVRGQRIDVEVVEVLHGLHRPQQEVGEAARETVRESPQRR